MAANPRKNIKSMKINEKQASRQQQASHPASQPASQPAASINESMIAGSKNRAKVFVKESKTEAKPHFVSQIAVLPKRHKCAALADVSPKLANISLFYLVPRAHRPRRRIAISDPSKSCDHVFCCVSAPGPSNTSCFRLGPDGSDGQACHVPGPS